MPNNRGLVKYIMYFLTIVYYEAIKTAFSDNV